MPNLFSIADWCLLAQEKAEKAKELAEDESKKLQGDVQKQTDDFIKQIDDKMVAKEKESPERLSNDTKRPEISFAFA